jgi:hypothetical protein
MSTPNHDQLTELFGEPISRYTDQDALADGVIVDISACKVRFRGMPVNRMTRGLWADLEPFVLPVAAAKAGITFEESAKGLLDQLNGHYPAGYLAELTSMLKTKIRMAFYQGDIWQVLPGLWLIENEVGGWTIMRPQDY